MSRHEFMRIIKRSEWQVIRHSKHIILEHKVSGKRETVSSSPSCPHAYRKALRKQLGVIVW